MSGVSGEVANTIYKSFDELNDNGVDMSSLSKNSLGEIGHALVALADSFNYNAETNELTAVFDRRGSRAKMRVAIKANTEEE